MQIFRAFRPSVPALIGLVVFAAALMAQSMLNDGDILWHVTAGQWMIDHRAVLHSDPFSYTFAGKPWMTHEWLSEVWLAIAWRLAGWGGVMTLTAACAGAAAYVLARTAAIWLNGFSLWLTVFLGLALVGPHLLARPHILVLPLLCLWVCGLVTARAQGRAPGFWLLGVMVLWANMHGSFLIGLGLGGVFALEAVMAAPAGGRVAVVRSWAIFLGLAGVACLLTPHGIDGIVFPVKLLLMPGIDTILEWSPIDFSKLSTIEVGLFAMLFVMGTREVRIPVLRLCLLIGLLYLALKHQRHEMILGVVAIAVLAEPLGRAFGQAAAEGLRPAGETTKGLAVVAAVAVLLVAGRLMAPVTPGGTAQSPAAALAAVPAALRAEPVLNEYGAGGYLISQGVRPFIDGRTDMYGPAFVAQYNAVAQGDRARLDAVLARYGVRWTLLGVHNGAVAAMDARPGWRRLYADKGFVVHVFVGHVFVTHVRAGGE